MAKVGTAHIELKPVLNEDALRQLGDQIERTVTEAVQRGLTKALNDKSGELEITIYNAGEKPLDVSETSKILMHELRRTKA